VAWPLQSLVLTTPSLELRGMTEADALALGRLRPEDLESDPERPSIGYDVEQSYWRANGDWKVEEWTLPFSVRHEGLLVGVQALEGKHFLALRVVDSWSWLLPSARGKGLGKQMRAAILELAFGHLGAAEAVSEAWDDNAASLGVSRALGYIDNGVDRHKRAEGAGRMQRIRLDAASWTPPVPVTVTGLEECLPLFGL
jgi:RimJ/RimL family protein N-acetyltransferase